MDANGKTGRGSRTTGRGTKWVAVAAGAAAAILAGTLLGPGDATAAAAQGTPVELRFVLRDPLPRGWDLRIESGTEDSFRSTYVDCQVGPDGVPDEDLRCEKRRYSQRTSVPEGQRLFFEFALVRPSGRETVVREGSRRVGDDPVLVRAVYERP